LPPDLAPFEKSQVAGFHRAVPSTALDKACMQFVYILLIFLKKSIFFFNFPDFFRKTPRQHPLSGSYISYTK